MTDPTKWHPRELVLAAAAPSPGCVGSAVIAADRIDDHWQDVSCVEFAGAVREVTAGLVGLGVCPGDHVAVLAATHPKPPQVQLGIAAAPPSSSRSTRRVRLTTPARAPRTATAVTMRRGRGCVCRKAQQK